MEKIALITGGSRGIRAATARLLAGRGYDICISYRQRAETAEALAEELRAFDVKAIAVRADISIVLGDYVFILLCISGLSIIAETMGGVFTAIKYLGAAYLIWLGIKLIKSPAGAGEIEGVRETSYLSNLLIDLLTTLGKPKAILFYVSFFPTFLDIASITTTDILAILLVTALSVGGVMLGYAFLAARASALLNKSASSRSVNLIGGGVLIGGGTVLAARA